MLTAILVAIVAAAPPPKAGAVIADELGMPEFPGLPETVAAKYEADNVTLDEVRKHPSSYPVRSAVLGAAESLRGAFAVRTMPDVLEARLDGEKARLVEVQKSLASAILKMREAVEHLDAAAKKRSEEPSARWQAHLDFLLAEVKLRIGLMEELNLAYGTVHRNELPPVKKGDTGWKLERDEKMRSKSDIRTFVDDAQAEFEAIQKTYAGTPWAKMAERELALKPGLVWVSTDVKRPQPFDPKKKKK